MTVCLSFFFNYKSTLFDLTMMNTDQKSNEKKNPIITFNDHIINFDNSNTHHINIDNDVSICDKLISCCNFCCIGVTTATLFAIVLGSIVWIIFAIKALNHTSNSDIKDKCKNSDLWVILLVNVIIFGVNLLVGLINNNNKDNNDNTTKNIIQFCLQIGIFIWTGIELNTDCAKNNLTDENIYILLYYWFYFTCSVLGLLIIGGCCFCCLQSIKE